MIRSSPRVVLRAIRPEVASAIRAFRQKQSRRAISSDQDVEVEGQLRSLQEVNAADDLVARGHRPEAVSLFERAVDICASSLGTKSPITRAAVHRLVQTLYDDQRFAAAETVIVTRLAEAKSALPENAAEILLLSKSQGFSINKSDFPVDASILVRNLAMASFSLLASEVERLELFQGKISAAVDSCLRAVERCEQDDDHTPDTEVLGQTLRQLGATQMLQGGAEEEAETSLLRAARLGASGIDEAKGLSGLASLNASVGGEQRVEEAVELWREAIASTRTTADPAGPNASGEGRMDGNENSSGGVARGNQDGVIRDLLLCRASVLCSAAQGELLLDRGTANASNHLAEALQLREDLLPSNHPAKAWTLALLGRCHLLAGEAVTAEGLLRAALDALGALEDSNPASTRVGGQEVVEGVTLYPSPLHSFSKATALRVYAELLMQWEKREAEGKRILKRAQEVEIGLPFKAPRGLTVHMLHLEDLY